jgi:peptidoglycan/LPS O-acetylase OafA/YrhL
MFILAGTMIIKVALAIWVHYVSHHALLAEALRMLQFEAMAIGGFAAYFLFHRTRPLSRHWLFFRPTQGVLVSLLMIRLFFHGTATKSLPLYATMFDHAVYAPLLFMVVFAWFILNVAVNERSIVRFDWRPLNYLGDISYGIYMYHGLAISLLFVPLREEYQAVTFIPATLLLHALVAAFTLLFAATSKAFFEDRFLRYKRQFQARTDRAEFVDGGKRPTTTATRELAA